MRFHQDARSTGKNISYNSVQLIFDYSNIPSSFSAKADDVDLTK